MEEKSTSKSKKPNESSANKESKTEPKVEFKISEQPTPDGTQVQAVVAEKDDVITAGKADGQPAVVVMKPPKKSKVGIIAAIVFVALFLIASACLAVWYFAIYNNPENVAFDAVRQFLAAENIITDGTIQIAEVNTVDGQFVAELEFNSTSNRIPQTTEVSLSFSERDADGKVIADHEVRLDLGMALMIDGAVYVRVSNLADAFDRIVYSDDSVYDYSDYGDMIDLAAEIIDLIDNQWWQISLTDIAQEIDSASDAINEVANLQKCLIQAANQDHSDEFIELYNDNRFLIVEKLDTKSSNPGDSLYSVDIDRTLLAAYLNGVAKSAATEDALACVNTFRDEAEFYGSSQPITVEDIPEITPADLRSLIPSGATITLSISDFGHRLRSANVVYGNDELMLNAELTFDYAVNNTTAPENYRPITDLYEEIAEILADYFDFDEILDDNFNFEEGIL